VKCSAVGQPGTAPASALSAGPAASPFSAGAPAPAGAAAGSELRDGSRAPAAASNAACEASLLQTALLLCTGRRLKHGSRKPPQNAPRLQPGRTRSSCEPAARHTSLLRAGAQLTCLACTAP